jgi:hypothetical protein
MPRSMERLGARSTPWVMVNERYLGVVIAANVLTNQKMFE